MIAKCIALLAIVAQINASVYNSNCGSSVNGVATTRNYVAKGKYPVALENCGPTPDRQIPVTTTHARAPVQEKPTVRLPYRIPAPRTVAHSCTCYKTIMRPRVHQHILTVPSVQRYIETSHTPVIENIHYEAVPYGCADSVVSGVASNVPVASGLSVVSPVGVESALPVASSLTVGSALPIASGVSVGSGYPYGSGCSTGSYSSGYSFSGVGNYN